MHNCIRIRCPNCDSHMKCGINERIIQENRDGIALCLSCGFRAGVVVVYQILNCTPRLRIPPKIPPGQTVSAPVIICPACRGPARVRTSQKLSESMKWIRVYCWDQECGYRCNAFVELTEQLSLVTGGRKIAIPYRAGLIDDFRRELEHRNKLPRLIYAR